MSLWREIPELQEMLRSYKVESWKYQKRKAFIIDLGNKNRRELSINTNKRQPRHFENPDCWLALENENNKQSVKKIRKFLIHDQLIIHAKHLFSALKHTVSRFY